MTDRLQQIREYLSKMTPGPWIATKEYVPHKLHVRGHVRENWPLGGTDIYSINEWIHQRFLGKHLLTRLRK